MKLFLHVTTYISIKKKEYKITDDGSENTVIT